MWKRVQIDVILANVKLVNIFRLNYFTFEIHSNKKKNFF